MLATLRWLFSAVLGSGVLVAAPLPRTIVPFVPPPSLTAPLVVKPDAPSQRSWAQEDMAWFEAHLRPAISKDWEGKPWQDEAWAFLKERLPRLCWRSGWTRLPEVRHSARPLREAGCDDPWILMHEAWDGAFTDTFNSSRDMATIREAYRRIRNSKLDPALLRFAALPLVMDYKDYPTDEEFLAFKQQTFEEFIGWTVDLGKSACYTASSPGLLYRHLGMLPAKRSVTRDLPGKLREAGSVPVWMIDTMEGKIEITTAWERRGSGWAHTVNPEAFEEFHRHLGEARRLLTTAWKARPDQPYAAAEMIKVVMGLGALPGENERLWFDRSMAICCDYYDAIRAYLTAMRPRWGGSREIMMKFALACMDTGRFDTDLPKGFFDAIDLVTLDDGTFAKVYTDPEVIPRVKALNALEMAAATTEKRRADARSFIMLHSWLCRDWAAGYEALMANKLRFTTAVDRKMEYLATTRFKIIGELAMFGGPQGETARKAAALEVTREAAGAVTLWKEWLEQFTGDDWLREIGEGRLQAAELLRDYLEGQWIKLPVDQPNHWDWLQGDWAVEAATGLTGTGGSPTGVRLLAYPLATGPHFEIRAKLGITGHQPTDRPQLLLNVGFDPLSAFSALTVVAELGPDGVHGSLGLNSFNKQESPRVFVASSSNANGAVELLLRRDANGLTYMINGQPVFEKSELSSGRPDWEQGQLSISGCELPPESQLLIESVEMRRLP